MHTDTSDIIDATVNSRKFITRHRLPALFPWTKTHRGYECVDKALGAGIVYLAIGLIGVITFIVLAFMNPSTNYQPRGLVSIIGSCCFLVCAVLYAKGSYYCLINERAITLGRKAFDERWAESFDLADAIVRVRRGVLWAGVNGMPTRPRYLVITIECGSRWMVLGVTKSESDAIDYASHVASLGVRADLRVHGTFRGWANM